MKNKGFILTGMTMLIVIGILSTNSLNLIISILNKTKNALMYILLLFVLLIITIPFFKRISKKEREVMNILGYVFMILIMVLFII
ncbi:MAG: hypothetical protein GF387_02655 [Candidatus Portnoybacteria bacterium]|nr:hypothetical protein [Candidatus Portnoybacteria bacterium]